jgi:hypothetical protein
MRTRTLAAIVAVAAAAGCGGSAADAERAADAAERAAAATQQAATATQQAAGAAQQTAVAAGDAAAGAQQAAGSPPAPGTSTGATPAAGDGSQQMARGLQQLAQGLQQMQAAQGDVVNHEQLKLFLPETLAGWTRKSARSEQVSVPFKVSNASGSYVNGASTMDVQIMDAALNQLILAPMSMFLVAGYEEKTDDGYKKYSPVAGSPGYEEWQGRSRQGEMTVILNNRFVINATGHNVDSVEPVRAVVQALDLARLAARK